MKFAVTGVGTILNTVTEGFHGFYEEKILKTTVGDRAKGRHDIRLYLSSSFSHPSWRTYL